MIVVNVSLLSANGPHRDRELVTLHISNVGGTDTLGNYLVQVIHPSGRKGRSGRVENYPRKAVAVGNLIRQSLEAVGYTK
jgi:hypothetical protein